MSKGYLSLALPEVTGRGREMLAALVHKLVWWYPGNAISMLDGAVIQAYDSAGRVQHISWWLGLAAS